MNRLPALCLSLLSGYAVAGVTVTMTNEAKRDSRLLIDNGRLRIDNLGPDGKPHAFQLDSGRKTIRLLDIGAKTYRQLELGSIPAAQDAQNSQLAQMEALLAQMPPDKRALVEEAIKRQGTSSGPATRPVRSFEPTGEKKKVAGFACEGYREKLGEKLIAESCLIPWDATGVTRADLDSFKAIRDLIPANAPESEDPLSGPGLPAIRTRFNPDGSKGESYTLSNLKKGAVSSEEFEVPAGFTKLERPSRPKK